MLRAWIIFSLFIVAIHAFGEFSVLSSPDSISFEGKDVLQSEYVDDVLNAAVGNAISGEADWDGMFINDPFNLPRKVIVLHVDGIDQFGVDSSVKTYPMEGDDAEKSLNLFITDLEADNIPVCNINFIEFEEGVANYRNCFGDMSAPVNRTTNLNPALHSEDKQFLESMSLINAASQNLYKMQMDSNYLIFHLSLEPIAKAHGHNSEAVNEATNLIATVVSMLKVAVQQSRENDALLVSIANKSRGRFKREGAGTPADPAIEPKLEDYNIAPYYDEDYPVIFNIVLWFMVTFGFALLAICYAIGTMDPGRDSIIYRMTSTRMKKDN